MGLLTITLRLPGTIGFTPRAHPTLQGQEELIGPSRGRIIVSRLTQGNHRFIRPADSFSDSLLDIMPSNGGRLPPDGTRVSFPETSAA
jgi:hypothetical protein